MAGRCGSPRLPPGLLTDPIALGTTTGREIAHAAARNAGRLPAARELVVFPGDAATAWAAAERDHGTAGPPSLTEPRPSCWDLRQAPAAVRGSCIVELNFQNKYS